MLILMVFIVTLSNLFSYIMETRLQGNEGLYRYNKLIDDLLMI